MNEIITIIVNFASHLWYTWIYIMMVLESSFFPFPSEVAMIPAWYLASTWQINFSVALIVWTFWALTWATINYLIGFYLWNKRIHNLIKKYWKYLLITPNHYKLTEDYFTKHWGITTFLARFITVVRQLISLPAWVFEMNFAKFFFYTWLWAGIWNLVLMTLWYVAWENQDLIKEYSFYILVVSILVIILIANIYYYSHIKKNAKI